MKIATDSTSEHYSKARIKKNNNYTANHHTGAFNLWEDCSATQYGTIYTRAAAFITTEDYSVSQ